MLKILSEKLALASQAQDRNDKKETFEMSKSKLGAQECGRD